MRPGSVLLKYFRNVASGDLNALFPNVRVVMSSVDKVFLGVPAIAGGIPILLNLALDSDGAVPGARILPGRLRHRGGRRDEGGARRAERARRARRLRAAAMGEIPAPVAQVSERAHRQHLLSATSTTTPASSTTSSARPRSRNARRRFSPIIFLRAAKTALTQAELERAHRAMAAGHLHVEVDFEVRRRAGQARPAGPAAARRRAAVGAAAQGDARAPRPRVGRLFRIQRGASGRGGVNESLEAGSVCSLSHRERERTECVAPSALSLKLQHVEAARSGRRRRSARGHRAPRRWSAAPACRPPAPG